MPAEFAKVHVPPPVVVPRGANWAARFFARLLRIVRRGS